MSSLKELLKGKIPDEKLALISRSFDVVGDIAIIEVPDELKKFAKEIAKAISAMQKNVKAVYMRQGGHTGKLRIQKLKHLYGEKRTETIHKENNIMLRLDVSKAYFSPRQSTERKRVYAQVKKPESVLVMFSGVGPFVISIAKNSPAKEVYGIELNKAAHKYATENAKLNKAEAKVKLFCGDVRKIVPKLGKKFDRVVMPLPKGAESFLPLAFSAAKKGAVINFYDFEKEEDIPNAAKAKVTAAAGKTKIKILNVVKCGQLAPRAFRVCVDFKIL
jgi:tRNA (guanine37-N1)-methyltransferase